ncbi:MAG TPA: site-2 protease family protein [Planctomycetota bacterium]|nr:site-2 protease family protein [Planctomycetota bacterium]
MFSALPLPSLLGLIAVLLLSLSWHEAAHAWVADRLGDPTARSLGRVTLNPIKHLDLFLSVLLPATLILAGFPPFGGGKPVPINVRNFRRPSRDFMLVAIAGPLSNLALSAAFGLAYVACIWRGLFVTLIPSPYGGSTPGVPSILPMDADDPWLFAVQMGFLINISLALFNLLPIPPLDGSRIVGWLLPRPLKPYWYRIDRFAFIMIIGLLVLLNSSAGGPIVHFIERAWFQAADVVDTLAWKVTPA